MFRCAPALRETNPALEGTIRKPELEPVGPMLIHAIRVQIGAMVFPCLPQSLATPQLNIPLILAIVETLYFFCSSADSLSA
jgi:hypothetical protein